MTSAQPDHGDPLRAYLAGLLSAPAAAPWADAEYIPVDAVEIPPGLPWSAIAELVDEAPPAIEATAALRRALRLGEPRGDGRPLTVLGPPHSGQTIALRRTALITAQAISAGGDGQFVAIYVPLSDYQLLPPGGSRLADTIEAAVRGQSPHLADMLRELLGAGRGPGDHCYLFLLDGLDIVPAQLRDELADELLSLARALPQHRFVVSCRPHAMPRRLTSRSRLLLLRYLQERQILRYLRRRYGEAEARKRFRAILVTQLLDIAALPPILREIMQRLDRPARIQLSHNRLVHDSLERSLARLPVIFQRGDAARQTLIELAWAVSERGDDGRANGQQADTLGLAEAFAIMARVRGERDYRLEGLYHALCRAGILVDHDEQHTRFVRPGIRAYCAALALARRGDVGAAMVDILGRCTVAERAAWWFDTLVVLAGMLERVELLLPVARAARLRNNGLILSLLAAILPALSPQALAQLDDGGPAQLRELLDACVARVDPAREPLTRHRARIARALGRLPFDASFVALRRILCERVRPVGGDKLAYDHTSVRVAAAYGLRNLSILAGGGRASRLSAAGDGELVEVLELWVAHKTLRLARILTDPAAAPAARIAAAYALGDLAERPRDIAHLLAALAGNAPALAGGDDDDALLWAAADALTICDAQLVADALPDLIARHASLGPASIEQMIYLAGRSRAQHSSVVLWLHREAHANPDPVICAKALRSLTWVLTDPHASPSSHGLRDDTRALTDRILRQGIAKLNLRGRVAPASPAAVIYLCRTAIDSLVWLREDQMITRHYQNSAGWPIELRLALHRATALLELKLD